MSAIESADFSFVGLPSKLQPLYGGDGLFTGSVSVGEDGSGGDVVLTLTDNSSLEQRRRRALRLLQVHLYTSGVPAAERAGYIVVETPRYVQGMVGKHWCDVRYPIANYSGDSRGVGVSTSIEEWLNALGWMLPTPDRVGDVATTKIRLLKPNQAETTYGIEVLGLYKEF